MGKVLKEKIGRTICGALFAAVLGADGLAQSVVRNSHRFEDYPAEVATKIVSAPPDGPLNVEWQLNFAGHFMMKIIAPGGDNLTFYIADAATGEVLKGDFFTEKERARFANALTINPIYPYAVNFKLSSRLMSVGNSCGWAPGVWLQRILGECGLRYFEWTGRAFRRVD